MLWKNVARCDYATGSKAYWSSLKQRPTLKQVQRVKLKSITTWSLRFQNDRQLSNAHDVLHGRIKSSLCSWQCLGSQRALMRAGMVMNTMCCMGALPWLFMWNHPQNNTVIWYKTFCYSILFCCIVIMILTMQLHVHVRTWVLMVARKARL